MRETSRVTSFAHLLNNPDAEGLIRRVEIPLIQRDYAQGRDDASTARIRASFLDVLHSALTGENPDRVGLDFVYGDVDSRDGALRPLDGQQRLTTLFLLHWYIAHRISIPLDRESWTAFNYATRPSAGLFCRRIVAWPPSIECEDPASWVRDQAWFQYVWRHDPTIQSMLTMITAIHKRFTGADLNLAWQRLTDASAPAISFHLLPIQDMGSAEDLYIKMNSRGKPLTEFENFKARLESGIAPIDPQGELAHKIDGSWANVFWAYRGNDDLIDDELLRYMLFLIEVCEWKQETIRADAAEARAQALFDTTNPAARDHLHYLIGAFDTWVKDGPEDYFLQLFAPVREGTSATDRVPLFVGDGRTSLFESCITTYGKTRGSTRVFTFGQQLLLCAILAYRTERSTKVDDVLKQRIRVIRNLIEASENEIRLDRMPAMLAEVEDIVLNGLHRDSTSFNRAQFDDELFKRDFIANHPELSRTIFELEDHVLLRGSLVAFDLDADSLPRRAGAFTKLFLSRDHWSSIAGALLAAGPYARPRDRDRRSFQFGVGEQGSEAAWRTVLAVGSRDTLTPTRKAFMKLLDSVARQEDIKETLEALREQTLNEYGASGAFDWRYYLVKYDVMREGRSGIYFGRDGALGYSLCMLHKTQLNSHYRDPYLFAIWKESAVGDRVEDPWFTGYERGERWLTLIQSGVRLRCLPEGFAVTPPTNGNLDASFRKVCSDFGVLDELLPVSQATNDNVQVDSRDRIQIGADLLKALVAAGC